MKITESHVVRITAGLVVFAVLFFVSMTSPFQRGASIPFPMKVGDDMWAPGTRFVACREVPLKPDPAGQLHPVTAYLRKFRPFPSKNALLCWKWSLENLSYVSDRRAYGREDVWQFPRQTLSVRGGDCEDLALFLCDWMRAEGFKARVAVGQDAVSGSWHAWVIWKTGAGIYSMETTIGRNFRASPGAEQSIMKSMCCRMSSTFDETGYWKSGN